MGPLLRSYVEMCEPIALSFGLVSGWAQALMYGMGVHVVPGKDGFLGCFNLFAPIGPKVSMA